MWAMFEFIPSFFCFFSGNLRNVRVPNTSNASRSRQYSYNISRGGNGYRSSAYTWPWQPLTFSHDSWRLRNRQWKVTLTLNNSYMYHNPSIVSKKLNSCFHFKGWLELMMSRPTLVEKHNVLALSIALLSLRHLGNYCTKLHKLCIVL